MTVQSIHEDGYDEKPLAVATTDDPNDTTLVATGEGGEAQSISEAGESAPDTKEQTGEVSAGEATGDDKGAESLEKTVPYGALHAEREMRKETQSQLLETQRLLGQMQGLKEQLTEMRQGKQEDTTEADKAAFEKEFDEDPIGALRKQNDALQTRLDSRDTDDATTKKAGEDAQASQEANQQQFDTFMTDVTSQVAEFEKGTPDYPQAFKHLMDARVEEYKAMGITDANQLETMFNREAISLAQGAIARGKNPAEVAYDMAKVRGYVRGDAKAAPAGETLEQQMARLEKGEKASSTLSGGTGSGDANALSLTDISTMSDGEFDKLWSDMESQSIHEV